MDTSNKQEENGSGQIFQIARRRKKVLILTPILVTILSGALLYILPKKYVSSTTILAKESQTLNPLVSYQMAVQVANKNQLNSITQIVFSRASVMMLIDHLKLEKPGITPEQQYELIKNVKKDIDVKIDKENIFTIEYTNQDPKKAKIGVDLLVNNFINTSQKLDNQQNLETVKFFEKEAAHLKRMLDETKAERLATIKKRAHSDPEESNALQSQLQTVNTSVDNIVMNLSHMQQQFDLINSLNNAIKHRHGNVMTLMKLDLTNLPYGSDLQKLLQKYINLRQNYTSKYPVVQSLKDQILNISGQIPSALMLKINSLTQQRDKLDSQQKAIVNNIEQYSVAKGEDQSQADNYGVYQDLYNQMNVKLEQAEVNYELGKQSKQQFVVIDPAIIPSKPTKPKKKLILVGGFMVGIFLGIISAVAAEMLDTTIHGPKELELYGKPIIAFIPEGKH